MIAKFKEVQEIIRKMFCQLSSFNKILPGVECSVIEDVQVGERVIVEFLILFALMMTIMRSIVIVDCLNLEEYYIVM